MASNLGASGGAPKLQDAPYQPPDLAPPPAIGIALSAALITVRHQQPMVFILDAACASDGDGKPDLTLPGGRLQPSLHDTLEQGVRELVTEQAGIDLGYTEQLCSFGEQGRVVGTEQDGRERCVANDQTHLVSIGYLALIAAPHTAAIEVASHTGRWLSCYDMLPWEDWRAGRPAVLNRLIAGLDAWASRPALGFACDAAELPSLSRRRRIDLAFGLNGAIWDDERALERHELLYEAGLLREARRDAGVAEPTGMNDVAIVPLRTDACETLHQNGSGNMGLALASDHRRMLAVALGRLRAKIKYRPIVFDLMDKTFTLYELQCTVEAVLGTPLHKQNFRRLVETTGLVEEVGDIRAKTGGRPAKLFRFRSHVVLERSAPGVRIKSMRA